MSEAILGSWIVAGFEGSTHVRADGRRLDLVAATRHDVLADRDYARMSRLGITAARESLRWHLVERSPQRYDFRPEATRVAAAARAGVTVAWDLCHFGWPDDVDPLARDFPARYAAWATAVARFIGAEQDPPYWFAPQNEISFLTWAGGEVGVMNPFARERGAELKRALVRATILAMDAIREELPIARFIHPEPLINVAADPSRPHERHHAAQATAAQFEAWDMLAGLVAPELGGSSRHLDVIGANYYPDNQWTLSGGTLPMHHPGRQRLAQLLAGLHERYRRPILVSETGAEDGLRGPWLRDVCAEVNSARATGVPVGGVCLYPILNHPGWEDDRHCCNGIWDYAGPRGGRPAYRPLVRQVHSWRPTRSVATSGREEPPDPGPSKPGRLARDRAQVERAGHRGDVAGAR